MVMSDSVQVPEGWEVVQLKQICHKISDGIHTTPKYSDHSDYYFINGNNLKNGRIVVGDNAKYVSKSEYLKSKTVGQNTISAKPINSNNFTPKSKIAISQPEQVEPKPIANFNFFLSVIFLDTQFLL